MANEISVIAGLNVNKPPLKVDQHTVSGRFDLAGTRYTSGVQAIGFAAHELIAVGVDVSTAGWAWFKNLDAINFVEIGLDVTAAFVPLLKLLPGEFALCPLTTRAVYAKANTGAVNLEFRVFER